MTLVVDASVVVALLVDSGSDGTWASTELAGEDLAAPHLLPVEVANVLRRTSLAGQLTADSASLAHADLLQLRVALFDYAPFGERVWELGANLTAYDAWYVAVAEALEVPLITLDAGLSRAPGPICEIRTRR